MSSVRESFARKDLRAFSRLISAAENLEVSATEALAELFPGLGKAKVIGVTGPPGAGKSTLLNHFVRLLRARAKTVAVIAVDPVSPFTGGALLGDRIRLVEHFNDPGVFIRSLSTRGKLGGLSIATREVVHLADAFGFDYILLETVGVGQSEVDVRRIADTTLVVLVPESGDSIQTLKAGILEIADFFVVHKADREGADRLVTELKAMLQIAGKDDRRVLKTSTQNLESLETLFNAIEVAAQSSNRRDLSRDVILELLQGFAAREAESWVASQTRASGNPYQFFIDFVKGCPPGSLFKK